jgi:hypothetical protein
MSQTREVRAGEVNTALQLGGRTRLTLNLDGQS